MAALSFRDAKKLMKDPHSCFKLETKVRHMALLPRYIGDLKKGIYDQLNAELSLYSPDLNGVMIAYSAVRRFQQQLAIIGSQPYLHFYIQADFIVFQPVRDGTLKGVINKVGRDYVGCLVHGCFNASIPKKTRDGRSLVSSQLDVGQTLLFKVGRYFANNGVLSIRGRFYEDSFTELSLKRKADEDAEDEDQENTDDHLPDIAHKKRRLDAPGALNPGPFTDAAQLMAALNGDLQGQDEVDSPKKKKKRRKHAEEEIELETGEANVTQAAIVLSESDTSKKKKKGHHRKNINDNTSIDSFTAVLPMNEGADPIDECNVGDVSVDTISPMQLNNEDTYLIDGSATKKKKKKKHKHKREDVHPTDESNVEEDSVDMFSSIQSNIEDTHHMDDSATKKKKKKKHKHKE